MKALVMEKRETYQKSLQMNILVRISFFVLIGLVWPVSVSEANVIPSCYDDEDIDMKPPPIKRGLLVVIDNTIELDQSLQKESFDKIMNFMKEGDRIIIVSFSAYVEGQYTKIKAQVQLDPHPETSSTLWRRLWEKKSDLKRLKFCLADRERLLPRFIGDTLQKIYRVSSNDLPKTELIANLAKVSREILPTLEAEETFLLIVSDMMENSDITSFYRNGKIRMIDPEVEMRQVEKSRIKPLYEGTVAYVIGAGYTDTGRYRPTKTMQAIERFWRLYMVRAGGRLDIFGTPSMFGDIAR